MQMRHVAAVLGTIALVGAAANSAVAQPSGRTMVPHPAWDCGMPEGIPPPEAGSSIVEIEIPLDRTAEIGRTQYGTRRVAVGLEGVVHGPRLSAVVTAGALDLELTLANGTIEIEQILVLKALDGSYIYARNAGTGADTDDVRVVVDFEAPNASQHAWLNTGRFVARRQVNAATKKLILRVYDVSSVTVDAVNPIAIAKPAGVPVQPWDYRSKAASERQGEILIKENVTLAPAQSVGPSKRGIRNIIPITGGEISGRITGKVLMGGADYQNLTPPATIDAHYLWQADDGEIIIVRNGGSFGSLVPAFEARVDGRYAFLNTGRYLSSNPSMGQGGVALSFYESTN
jgi:Protein of unknown function (DUF3237)